MEESVDTCNCDLRTFAIIMGTSIAIAGVSMVAFKILEQREAKRLREQYKTTEPQK